jgi:hypothetical protein
VLSCVFVVLAGGQVLVFFHAGMQKFGDFDDVAKYFRSGSWNSVTKLVFTEKANGQNAKVFF